MRGISVLLQLLRKDLIVFKRELLVKFIDTVILLFTNVMAFGYLLPQASGSAYTAFFVVGAIGSFGFIEIVGKVGILLADIDGDRKIFHTLAMPMGTKMTFCYIAISWAITSTIMSSLLFPVGKLMTLTRWSWELMSVWRVIIMLITANLFFGFFALWLSSVVKGMMSLNSLWLRYIAPMWMFGGYVYSWQQAYSMSHVVGYISLANPMLYVMEGVRAAALGNANYLPFWVCVTVLWGFIFACGSQAIKKMKVKLDCI